MSPFLFLVIGLLTYVQGSGPDALTTSSCITEPEKKKLASQEKIDNRVKIYREISTRFHKSLQGIAGEKEETGILPLLSCWQELLSASLKDVELNINRKKKSGALKDYEIQIRKAIVDVENARLKAAYQEHAAYDAWLAQANTARERFVDILFQRDK